MLAQDPCEIIKRSVVATNRSWKERLTYVYTSRVEQRHFDSRGVAKASDVDISKATPVSGNVVEQIVSHNGGPPTAAQQRRNNENLRKAKSETASDRAERLQSEKEGRAFVDDIPKAFHFRLLGEETINGRSSYVVEAKPNLAYHARSKYGKMFSKVEGKIWVDKQDYGWVKVDAKVIEPVAFGLILARVQPGTHVIFEQVRVADGSWMPRRVDVKADAKILFVKNYQLEEIITYSDYQPAQNTQVAALERAR